MSAFASEETEWYYLDDEAANMGPFNISEMCDFFASGLLKDTTFVWHEDIGTSA